MKLSKIIKRYGNAAVVSFTKEDLKILRVKPGDILELQVKGIKRIGKRL